MTTIGQMQDLLIHIAMRVNELCVHSSDYPNIDEWDGFAETFDIHFENQDDINTLNVVVYGLKTIVGEEGQMTDTDNIFHKASYDIKATKETSKAMEASKVGDITVSLIQDATKRDWTIFDKSAIQELAKTVAGFLEGDSKFSNRVQQNVYDSLEGFILDRIERSVTNRVDVLHASLSRTEIVNELVENESFMNGNFIRGMMDNSRFRTHVSNLVQSHVNSYFSTNQSWLVEMIDEAIEQRTTLMVNETVERSLKLIASRISAGSDV